MIGWGNTRGSARSWRTFGRRVFLLCVALGVVGLGAGFAARLPRAGVWMLWIKRLFALVMLAVAEYYLVKMGQLLF